MLARSVRCAYVRRPRGCPLKFPLRDPHCSFGPEQSATNVRHDNTPEACPRSVTPRTARQGTPAEETVVIHGRTVGVDGGAKVITPRDLNLTRQVLRYITQLNESRSPIPSMPRPLNVDEKRLLRNLLRRAGWPEAKQLVSEELLVSDMNDGGMGSLRFFCAEVDDRVRRFGTRIAELEFTDIDGVTVIAPLNVDQEGELFELNIWKTNFGRTLKLPR